ncbi:MULTISPECIES: 50S ribosomal protein L35 [Desulfonatronum]|jgi:large subunit ribosomal protein L35|uniref:50S ribosomal protein L35 n=1 Tax=Desulfonatronum TaxID=66848 RepID=UPI00048DF766|nr:MULTISPECIES: 50S ribosomal protein L35 [Desulfonatronum]SMP53399.1 LSU ribosomal protein L35P [Desulfonatronum zhilinae]
MPKMKTRKSAAKRFKLTGSGKIKRRKAFMSHILTKKSPKRKRQLGKDTILAPANVKSVRKMIPFAK